MREAILAVLAAVLPFAGMTQTQAVPPEAAQTGAVTGTVALGAQTVNWRGTAMSIPDDVWAGMQGVSWHEALKCPARDDLRLLEMKHIGVDGAAHAGRMIVARELAEDVLSIFAELAAAGFVIERMEPVDAFGGDDDLSMAANNTSGFNCRTTPGTSTMSQHAYGRAIDINPVQNPYVIAGRTMPPEGAPYDQPKERKGRVAGMIARGDAVVTAFARHGWGWGGAWKNSKDYQHFSRSGN